MADNVRIELTGTEELSRELKRLQRAYPEAAAAALYAEGMAIMALAQKKTPVDTGRLRATGYVAPPVKDAQGHIVELGFGTDYGIYVHERTESHHPVGEAKFLENAINARKAGWAERLAKRIKENVERGIGVTALISDPNIASSREEGEKRGKAAARKTLKARKKKK